MAVLLSIGQSIIVGRQGSQPLQIADMTVSRRHCKITRVTQDEYELEDLDSSRGTVVNGQQIYQTRVRLDTPVSLGNFATSVGQLLGFVTQHNGGGSVKLVDHPQGSNQPPVKTLSIGHLERVFDEYEENTKNISKQRARQQGRRALPMQIGMPLIMFVGIIIDVAHVDDNTALAFKMVLSLVCVVLTLVLTLTSFSSNDTMVEDTFETNKQFQIDYVCPGCKNFLGMNRPVQALLNSGKCPYCKSRFVR